jgi:hypothetical protein
MDEKPVDLSELLVKLRVVALAEGWNSRRLTNTTAAVKAMYGHSPPGDEIDERDGEPLPIDIGRTAVEHTIERFLSDESSRWSAPTRRSYASHWRTAAQALRDLTGEYGQDIPDDPAIRFGFATSSTKRTARPGNRLTAVAEALRLELGRPAVAQGRVPIGSNWSVHADLVADSTVYKVDPALRTTEQVITVLGLAAMLRSVGMNLTIVVAQQPHGESLVTLLANNGIAVKHVPASTATTDAPN